jgi:hypothetical protein
MRAEYIFQCWTKEYIGKRMRSITNWRIKKRLVEKMTMENWGLWSPGVTAEERYIHSNLPGLSYSLQTRSGERTI